MHETAITKQGLARLSEESRAPERLRSAQLVELLASATDASRSAERVCLHNLDSGERLDLDLVGQLETDVSAGRISITSPLGKAIVET